MDVEVLELCTRTVTRIPTTRPATGLDRMALSLKIVPATFPVHKRGGVGGEKDDRHCEASVTLIISSSSSAIVLDSVA